MSLTKRPAFTILCFALGGLALAVWLSVFAKDLKRPTLPQERADRLAAANYLSGSLRSESPPSPSHWAQLLVWHDPASGLRYPLSRDASAILLAACGGRPTVAGVLAFGLAAGTLGWLFSVLPPQGTGRMAVISTIIMLGVARGRDWQMTDPHPFLVMASSTAAFAAWLLQRDKPTRRGGWILGWALGGVLLCETSLAVLFLIILMVDRASTYDRTQATNKVQFAAFGLRQITVVLALFLSANAVRNNVVTGNLLIAPASLYRESNVTAPSWFWEKTQTPQAHLDPVFERYDELVAIPASHWSPPVYRAWLNRIYEGASYAGGLILAIAALVAAIALPAKETRPAWLLAIGLCVIALLRYSLSSTWWPMLTPAIVVLVVAGLQRLTRSLPQSYADRLLALGCLLQVATLPVAAHARPTTAEYDYLRRIQEIADKLKEKSGKHLVFASLDSETDGRIEPANLPHSWAEENMLIARDLGPSRNTELVAALPDRTPWRVLIMPKRVGLQSYSQISANASEIDPGKKRRSLGNAP